MTFWDSEPPPPAVDPYAESAGGPDWRDPIITPKWPTWATSIDHASSRTPVTVVHRDEIVDPGASLALSGPSGDVYVRDSGADLEWAQHFTAWCREQPDPAIAISEWTKRIRGGNK